MFVFEFGFAGGDVDSGLKIFADSAVSPQFAAESSHHLPHLNNIVDILFRRLDNGIGGREHRIERHHVGPGGVGAVSENIERKIIGVDRFQFFGLMVILDRP